MSHGTLHVRETAELGWTCRVKSSRGLGGVCPYLSFVEAQGLAHAPAVLVREMSGENPCLKRRSLGAVGLEFSCPDADARIPTSGSGPAVCRLPFALCLLSFVWSA